jgi:hypothetical protein
MDTQNDELVETCEIEFWLHVFWSLTANWSQDSNNETRHSLLSYISTIHKISTPPSIAMEGPTLKFAVSGEVGRSHRLPHADEIGWDTHEHQEEVAAGQTAQEVVGMGVEVGRLVDHGDGEEVAHGTEEEYDHVQAGEDVDESWGVDHAVVVVYLVADHADEFGDGGYVAVGLQTDGSHISDVEGAIALEVLKVLPQLVIGDELC